MKTLNLAALPLVVQPRRFAAYCSECLIAQNRFRQTRIPHRHVFEVLAPGDGAETYDVSLTGLREGRFHWLRGSYTLDILSLALICRILKPKTVFEIGTLRGYTTSHLAMNSPADARIYTLDLPKTGCPVELHASLLDAAYMEKARGVSDYYFSGHPAEAKIRCLEGDSATFDFEPFRGGIDLFLIDGAHSIDYVRNDTEKAIECCHPGSVIAWHDYGRIGVRGVTQHVNDLSASRQIYVVPGGSLAYTVVP